MADTQSGIRVRRARPSDAERIAAFVNKTRPQSRGVAPENVLEHFGKAGLLLAENGDQMVGLLGWRAENLIARITDFLIYPARFREEAGQALLASMEQAAHELQCEATVLLITTRVTSQLVSFWEKFGFTLREVANLPRPWQEVAREIGLDMEDQMLIKQLRQDRVVRPL
jgi:N-acetylglutamate synthase-like GNAT family acetyltransferase